MLFRSEIIGRALAEQFFGRHFDAKPSLSIKLNRPIPVPEATQPIPHKYLPSGDLAIQEA